jgi:hypothetical protein
VDLPPCYIRSSRELEARGKLFWYFLNLQPRGVEPCLKEPGTHGPYFGGPMKIEDFQPNETQALQVHGRYFCCSRICEPRGWPKNKIK